MECARSRHERERWTRGRRALSSGTVSCRRDRLRGHERSSRKPSLVFRRLATGHFSRKRQSSADGEGGEASNPQALSWTLVDTCHVMRYFLNEKDLLFVFLMTNNDSALRTPHSFARARGRPRDASRTTRRPAARVVRSCLTRPARSPAPHRRRSKSRVLYPRKTFPVPRTFAKRRSTRTPPSPFDARHARASPPRSRRRHGDTRDARLWLFRAIPNVGGVARAPA